MDALRAVAPIKIDRKRRTEGRRATTRWAVGDEVCAPTAITKSGRQQRIREGVVAYTSSHFVVVEFERYREAYEPWNVWAPSEEPPSWVKLDRVENDE